jgi:hypothetical protein
MICEMMERSSSVREPLGLFKISRICIRMNVIRMVNWMRRVNVV